MTLVESPGSDLRAGAVTTAAPESPAGAPAIRGSRAGILNEVDRE